LNGLSLWWLFTLACVSALSIPLNGFLGGSLGMSWKVYSWALSIPLNGFPYSSLISMHFELVDLFQFHWMDSYGHGLLRGRRRRGYLSIPLNGFLHLSVPGYAHVRGLSIPLNGFYNQARSLEAYARWLSIPLNGFGGAPWVVVKARVILSIPLNGFIAMWLTPCPQ